MNHPAIEAVLQEIIAHETNQTFTQQGLLPLFVASPYARIAIVGQAPGIRAQINGAAWSDASGTRLMRWLGVTEEQFRDPNIFAHLPMDFYYPGKGKSGDLPPRKDFAPAWHPQILELLPDIELFILIGQYSQCYYLQEKRKESLTATIQAYEEYLPTYMPIVHPSPLNFRWFKRNEWFEQDVVPILQQRVAESIAKNT